MVKLQDGSMVAASELLSGSAEDEEGNKLKFTEVKDAAYPTYEAKSKLEDGTNRMRTYTFSLADTLVKVQLALTEEGAAEKKSTAAKATTAAAGAETQKSVKEVSPAAASSSTTDAKKNSSNSSSDYRIKSHT